MVRMVENLLSITRMNDEGTRLTTHEELAEEIVSSAVVKFSKRFQRDSGENQDRIGRVPFQKKKRAVKR